MMFPVSYETAITFFAAALILSLSPGPDNIFVLTQSVLFGTKAGVMTTFGLVTGLTVHTLIVTFGVATILQAHPTIFNIIKLIGACYLIYLACLSFKSGASQASFDNVKFPGYFILYLRGIFMSATNPKVTLFFLAFLPPFVNQDKGNIKIQFLLLSLFFMLSALLVFNSVAVLSGKIGKIFNESKKWQLYINRVAGFVFVSLAVSLFIIN